MFQALMAIVVSMFIFIEKAEGARWVDTDIKDDPRWGLRQIESNKLGFLSSPSVIVAIIDTGIDIDHPDFKDRLWTNPGETGTDNSGADKSTNKIDDDGNGYVDDLHGWNFASHNSDLQDHHGHGTHVAGLIGGSVTGVTTNVKLMILKYYDPNSNVVAPMSNTIKAIEYATRMNARIINFSAGGREPNSKERAAIATAGQNGILFVAAAGNERSNSDVAKYFPADYELSNIISVGSITFDETLSEFSNYGTKTVDLVAPGGPVISTAPNGKYEVMSGTSQATAFVSGVAAILISKMGMQTRAEEIIEKLATTGKPNANLVGKVKYEVQVNAYRALVMKNLKASAGGLSVTNFNSIDNSLFTTD